MYRVSAAESRPKLCGIYFHHCDSCCARMSKLQEIWSCKSPEDFPHRWAHKPEGREKQLFPTGRYRARNPRSVALGSAQCFSPFRPKLFGIYCFHHCDSGCARDVKASGDLDHVNLLEISHTGEHTSLRVEKWRTYRVFARFFIAFSWFVKDF